MLAIDELWISRESGCWEEALKRYWAFVKPANVALERRLDRLDLNYLRALDAAAWFAFLRDDYFRWKYTAANRYATTIQNLQRYVEDGSLEELHEIKRQLLAINLASIGSALLLARQIRGLGTAGASGLLALMYPASFATVDQFVVKSLRSVKDLPEANTLALMNENSLTIKDGVALIEILRRKAAMLNSLFATDEWTPRRIDMILWTYGRDDDSAEVEPESARNRRSRDTPAPPHEVAQRRITNHEMMSSALKPYAGKTLDTSQIKVIVRHAFPEFSEGSVLPNDHALGNKSACSCAGTERRIFDRVGPGKYLVR